MNVFVGMSLLVFVMLYSSAPVLSYPFAARCLDCHTLQLISRDGKSLVDCSKTSLPFCDNFTFTCSAIPPPSCVNPDNFTCLSDGYFPDPWNCQAFHLCVDRTPTKYFCDANTPSYNYYDVILHRCTSSAHCGFKCTGKTGVKVAHPDDPNLFAYCYNGTSVLQDRCPGNYELNEVTERCEAVCHTNGVLVDLEDCTKFYRCMYQNYGYYRSHEQCPQGLGFNPLTLQCEDGPCEIAPQNIPDLYRSPLLVVHSN